MPLRLPWNADVYAVRVGPHTIQLSRTWLEFLADEGRDALFQGIVDEVRRRYPGGADELRPVGLVIRIEDRRRAGTSEPRLYALWLDD